MTTTQSELEKTQLEIAKLQLEQERHKLTQMQRRQGVVDGLGQGAVAAGEATKSGLLWATYVVVSSLLMGAGSGLFAAAFMLMTTPKLCRAYPDADLLYRIGCEVGSKAGLFLAIAVAGAAYGAYEGHKRYRSR